LRAGGSPVLCAIAAGDHQSPRKTKSRGRDVGGRQKLSSSIRLSNPERKANSFTSRPHVIWNLGQLRHFLLSFPTLQTLDVTRAKARVYPVVMVSPVFVSRPTSKFRRMAYLCRIGKSPRSNPQPCNDKSTTFLTSVVETTTAD
jgi:hypothetical protein